jgi:hypothetical protein
MGLLDSIARVLGTSKLVVGRDDITAPGAGTNAVRALLDDVATTKPTETRARQPLYFEGVIERARMDELCSVLESHLGAPAQPFDRVAQFEDGLDDLIASHGGIFRGQCLYLRQFEDDGAVAFAALWPWENGRLVTLKVGLYD